MAATGPGLPVSSIAWTAVIALTFCRQIRITENRGVSGYPHGDFLVNKNPAPDLVGVVSPPVSPNTARIQAGAQYTFEGEFSPGQTAGFIQLINVASTTFDQDEGQI